MFKKIVPILPQIIALLFIGAFAVFWLTSAQEVNAETATFYSTASDGYIIASDSTYSSAREAAQGGGMGSTATLLWLGQYYWTAQSNFVIDRAYLYFDTSSLPDDALITSATLELYFKDDQSDADFNIVIQNGQPNYPSDPLQFNDFNYTYYSGDGGSLSTSGLITTGYSTITLNSTGLSWINKTGVTKSTLRNSREISGTSPSTSLREIVSFYSNEKGTGYQPKLTVSYSPGAASPDFSISSSATSLRTPQTSGASDPSLDITVTSVNFNSSVNLSVVWCSSLTDTNCTQSAPSGVTPSFSANPITPPTNSSINSTLSIDTNNTSAGTYYFKVGGTSGALVHKTEVVTLTVVDLSVSLLVAPSSGAVPLNDVDLAATVSGTATGTINYKFDCTNDGTWDYTFNNISDNPKIVVDACNYSSAGTYTAKVKVERDVANPAEDTETILVTSGPPPDFSISSSATLLRGPRTSGTSDPSITLTVTSLNGFNSAVTLWIFWCSSLTDTSCIQPAPSGVTPSFSTNPVTPPTNSSINSTLSIDTNNTPTGTYYFKVGGTSGAIVHNVGVITLNIIDLSVTLSANPSSGNVPLNGVDLTATVSGTAIGAINYKFDCTNDGNWDHSLDNISDNPKTVVDACNYSSAGTYTAKVKVERDVANPAESTTIITVATPLAVTKNVSGWAWSENIGWISFNSSNCDVDNDGIYEGANEGGGAMPAPAGCPTSGTVQSYGAHINSNGNLTGYAWSENIGWIHFAPAGPYPALPNYSACIDLPGSGQACDGVGNYKVAGWARACGIPVGGTTVQCGGDGWDGWIKLRGANYGVDITQSTGEFNGWAWGDSVVVGGVSFNCKDGGYNEGTGASYNVCGTSNHKVKTSFAFNRGPNKPVKVGDGEVWSHCSFLGRSIPIFSWTYSDPDGDSQTAYEIEVDDNSSFAAPKFNHLVNLVATSYVLDLSQDDAPQDWISELAWNANYFWRVRVKDSQNNWSDWSNSDVFGTPRHAYPWPDFIWTPSNPTQGEVVIFDSSASQVFGGTTISSYLWTLTQGTGQYVDDTSNTSAGPHITFSTPDNKIRLEMTDSDSYSCQGSEKSITVQLPLPEYEEIPPIFWKTPLEIYVKASDYLTRNEIPVSLPKISNGVKKFFLAIINFFDGIILTKI